VPPPDAVSSTEVVIQVRVPPAGEMAAAGGVVLLAIMLCAEAVHPLTASVTVTVYVPAELMVRAAVVEALFHK